MPRGGWWRRWLGRERWPLRGLQLELINRCNYRCPLCRTLLRDGVRRRALEPGELGRILDPVAAGLEAVTLYGTRGEPFLHPDLAGCLAAARARTAARSELSSNGSLVTEERARAVLAAGVDRVIFAIDGLSEESYRRYRVGGSLERVLDNVARFCALRRAGGHATRVVLQTIPMAGNEHELEGLPALGRRLGVDEVRLKLSASVSASPEWRPRAGRLRLPRAPVDAPLTTCPSGLDRLYVDPNGDCYPCCYAEGLPELRVGNALEAPLDRLWRESPLLGRIRAGFAGAGPHHPFCLRTCGRRARQRKLKLM